MPFLNAKIIATIPIFIAVNIAAVTVWFFGFSQQSMPLVLGIIAGGLVDLDNRLTGRLKNLFYTLVAFSISSLTAQFFIIKPIPFILVMTAMTFLFTMLGAVGQRYSTIAFGTLVVSIYTTLAYRPETLWYINPSLILCGTLLYSLIAMAVYLFFPNRPVQESVAKSFIALGDYLEAKAIFFDPDDIDLLDNKQVNLEMKNSALINAFNACRMALFYRIRGQHRHSRTMRLLRYYFTAQDIHERINSNHFNYPLLTERLKNTDLLFRIQRLLLLQAQACRDVASSLQQNTNYQYNIRLERAITGINQSFENYAQQQTQQTKALFHLKSLLENLQNVDWQLRHLEQQTNLEQSERAFNAKIHTENVTGLRNIFFAIRSQCHFQSQLFRHAVRLSIVVFVICSLVASVDLERGYWVLLTAVFVCQPNYSATKIRLKQRIIGTILGVLVGSLLPYMTSTLEAKLGIVVISSTLFFFFRSNNYSFSTFFITIQVLASFDIMGFDIYAATFPRLLDTMIGTAVAWLAVSYLWPDWKYLELNQVVSKTIKSNAKYLMYVISFLQFGKVDDLKYRVARRNAHENATALSTTVSNMNNEPKKYAAYLQKGFELLKLNHSLLSYISALATYRHNMKRLQQSAGFLSEFYPIAKKIIQLLEQLESLSQQEFEHQYLNIDLSLKDYTERADGKEQEQFDSAIQQLHMINQMLPNLYALLH